MVGDTSYGIGAGGDNRDPRDICIQVPADGLCWSCDVTPSGVAIPAVDCPGDWIKHGICGGGPGKQFYAKTNGATEHLRKAEKYYSPRNQ